MASLEMPKRFFFNPFFHKIIELMFHVLGGKKVTLLALNRSFILQNSWNESVPKLVSLSASRYQSGHEICVFILCLPIFVSKNPVGELKKTTCLLLQSV